MTDKNTLKKMHKYGGFRRKISGKKCPDYENVGAVKQTLPTLGRMHTGTVQKRDNIILKRSISMPS